jgi:hypothetical protein
MKPSPSLNRTVTRFLTIIGLFAASGISQAASETEMQDLSINGGVQNGKARLTIEGQLFGPGQEANPLFATTLEQLVAVNREKQSHTITATFDVLQGNPKEFTLTLTGEG